MIDIDPASIKRFRTVHACAEAAGSVNVFHARSIPDGRKVIAFRRACAITFVIKETCIRTEISFIIHVRLKIGDGDGCECRVRRGDVDFRLLPKVQPHAKERHNKRGDEEICDELHRRAKGLFQACAKKHTIPPEFFFCWFSRSIARREIAGK